MKKLSFAVLSICFVGGVAQAQPQNLANIGSASFGAQNQVSIASDFNISFLHHSGISELSLQPAAVYFIAPHLAIGGQVIFTYHGTDAASETHVGLGPRIGYDIPISSLLSFFPQGGFRFEHATASIDTPTGSVSSSANYLTLMLYAPFLFHPAQHFFIGLGPSLTVDLAGGNSDTRETTIGLESTVGGWFDW